MRMFDPTLCRARKTVGLLMARAYDLRHTGTARLRAAGVSHEDRPQKLEHASGTMTTHYSAAYLQQLLNTVNRICESRGTESDPIILR